MDSLRSENRTNPYPALATLVTVFFFWGFIAAGNSVFIPFCKHFFALDQFQSQLIDFSFYLAYFLGAMGLYALSVWGGRDVVALWGYRASLVRGLLVSAFGAAVMIGMVLVRSFEGMLAGLFVMALGFSLQQTAAQPLALALGDPESGAARISLGGGVNSFGTAIGPLVVSLALFGSASAMNDEAIRGLSLHKVVLLYCAVGLLFVAAAALFQFSKNIPGQLQGKTVQAEAGGLILLLGLAMPVILLFVFVLATYHSRVETEWFHNALSLEWMRLLPLIFIAFYVFFYILFFLNPRKALAGKLPEALKDRQLRLGMLAIFVYVGVEVSIVSNLGELLRQPGYGAVSTAALAPYVALYWGSLMMGRWTGAVAAFPLSGVPRRILTFCMPLLAFGVVLVLFFLNGFPLQAFLSYWPFPVLAAFLFHFTNHRPALTLWTLSLLGALLIVAGMFFEGPYSRWCFVATGLMCSVLWPCIFDISVRHLGPLTTQGSAFLIMMILGGAILPPLQGKIADLLRLYGWGAENAIRWSYWLDVGGFGFLAWFGFMNKTSGN
ncbi:MAG: MFS transporter [Flavobacteriales bacterium]|nr:MFS transporter [Flavobacteriales bacterium]